MQLFNQESFFGRSVSQDVLCGLFEINKSMVSALRCE